MDDPNSTTGDGPNNTAGTLEADEYTVSDDALEAAADIEGITRSIIQCHSLFCAELSVAVEAERLRRLMSLDQINASTAVDG
jgi:hypothetical protein